MGPHQLSNFRILREIHVDSDVRVFAAHDESLNRPVVLYWLPDDATDAGRKVFLDAVRALGAAGCEHLPAVFEIADNRADPYCVLECFNSGSLDKWLMGFPPSIADSVQVGRQLADALRIAESIGLAPVSLDADSVWLERPRDGVVGRQAKPPVVKLRDFRALDPGSEDAVRQQTLRGLGVILLRLLSHSGTGCSPIDDDPLPPLTALASHVPASLVQLVEELLRVDSGQSSEHLTLAAAADRLAAIERRESRRRTQWPATASIVAAAGVLCGLLGLWFGFHEGTHPQPGTELSSKVPTPVARDKGGPVPVMTQPLAVTSSAVSSESASAFEPRLSAYRTEPLAAGWLEIVQSLPAQQQLDAVVIELRRRNLEWDGSLRNVSIKDDRVLGFLMTTDHVGDIAPLAALADLEWLAVPGRSSHSGKVRDLSPLAGLRLRTLRAGWTQVRDLSPLAGMPLKELKIGGTQVIDLTPLAGMEIEQLEIWGNNIQDLSPLAGLPRLKILRIGYLPVRDLSPLTGLPLEMLDCEKVFPLDWSPLASLPLVSVRLDYAPDTHLEILRSIRTLREINGQPAAEVLGE